MNAGMIGQGSRGSETLNARKKRDRVERMTVGIACSTRRPSVNRPEGKEVGRAKPVPKGSPSGAAILGRSVARAQADPVLEEAAGRT